MINEDREGERGGRKGEKGAEGAGKADKERIVILGKQKRDDFLNPCTARIVKRGLSMTVL